MARGELFAERLTHSVIGAFFEAYNTLGYGFLEQVCILAFEEELLARGHLVGREVAVPIRYKGKLLATHRADIIVDEVLIVEVKSTEVLHSSATRQLYNYLRAADLELGLLFHFGPKPGFWRVRRNRKRSIQSIPSIQSMGTSFSDRRDERADR